MCSSAGRACGLSAARFTHEGVVTARDPGAGTVSLASTASDAALVGGLLRWVDGPQAGQDCGIIAATGGVLLLDVPIDPGLTAGLRAELLEGCDHTLATCATRFGNAVNFQGEPFLPGNDLVTRYPSPAA